MSDLVQKIKDRMADYDQGDPVTAFVDAIEAVLDLEPLTGFGPQRDAGWLDYRLSAIEAIASALGVREDQPEGE